MSAREHPWWQTFHKAAFIERISQMSIEELEVLGYEMAAVLTATQAQIETNGPEQFNGDSSAWYDWRRRANAAKGYIAEKRSLLRAELRRRGHVVDPNATRAARAAECARLIEDLATGGSERDVLRETLTMLRDFFRPKEG